MSDDEKTRAKFIEEEPEFEPVNHLKVIFRAKLFYFAAFWFTMMWGLLVIGAEMLATLLISLIAIIFLKILGEIVIYFTEKFAILTV